MNDEYNLIGQRPDLYSQRAKNYFLNVTLVNRKPYFGREEISTITQKPFFFEKNSTIENLVFNYSLMPKGDGEGPAGNSDGKRDGSGRDTNSGNGGGRGRNRNTSGAGTKTGAKKGNC